MIDYRNTIYCKNNIDINMRKKKVKEEIIKKHPKARNFYNFINDNNSPYKKSFMQAYNNKCAYCGTSIDLIDITSFEIDHFRHKKSKEFKSEADAGYIENLVLACRNCNRKKGEFLIDDTNAADLNPDGELIKANFVRDALYYIRVSEVGMKKPDVVSFYDKLHLNSEKHRLDYLLMSIIGLQDKLKMKGRVYAELGNVCSLLLRKRNFMVV